MDGSQKIVAVLLFSSQALWLAACGGSSGGGSTAGGGGEGDASSYAWAPRDTGLEVSYELHDVFFANDTTGWIVGKSDGTSLGRDSVILQTVDGGQTWTEQESGTHQYLQGVHFVDENRGWIAAGHVTGMPPTVLHTTNQGQHWSFQDMPTAAEDAHLFDIQFLDADTGWAVGGEVSYSGEIYGTKLILHSSNGGSSWTVQHDQRVDVPVDFDPDWNGNADPLRAVHFVDASNGWAVPGPERGTYFRTRDAGQTWEVEDTAVTERVGLYANTWVDVHFRDHQRGWVVGGGTIMHTSDGGTSWSVQHNEILPSLRSIDFVDASTGWVVGGAGNGNEPMILRTTNGGQTWEEQEIDAGEADIRRLNAVHAIHVESAWAAGSWKSVLTHETAD